MAYNLPVMRRSAKALLGAGLIIAAAVLLLKFVVPSFANLFAGFGVEIPLPAWFVMRYPYHSLLMAVLVVVVLPIAAIALGVRLVRGKSSPPQ